MRRLQELKNWGNIIDGHIIKNLDYEWVRVDRLERWLLSDIKDEAFKQAKKKHVWQE